MKVIREILDDKGHDDFKVINTDDIVEKISSYDVSASHLHNVYESVYQFYYFLTVNCKMALPVTIETIKKLGHVSKKKAKVEEEDNKRDNIPEPMFTKLFNGSLAIMRDVSKHVRDRIMAAYLILFAHLGLRIDDMIHIMVDDFHEVDVDGLTMHYLHYYEEKVSKPNSPVYFDIFMSDEATEAFQIIREITDSYRVTGKQDLLLILPQKRTHGKGAKKTKYPCGKTSFRNVFNDYLLKYFWREFTTQWDSTELKERKFYDAEGHVRVELVSLPVPSQFRVHLCTWLYQHGVKLSYIEQHMGHLSYDMYGYYIRRNDTRLESAKKAEEFIRNIASENLVPIGALSDKIIAGIKRFIAKNNFKVETDMDSILKALDEEVRIQPRIGGFCYRESRMDCKDDPATNSLRCAYGVCPNIYTFYYMADISKQKYDDAKAAYAANLKRGLLNATQKELAAVKIIINRELSPQIEQLEKEIAKHGQDTIMTKYPNLVAIINNIDNIKKDMKLWKQKK
jgi:hypothetical protein